MSDSFTGQQINASIIRLTAAQWTAQSYVLPVGVIGIESDTGAYKIGDGATAWASLLAYSAPTGVKVYRALLSQTGTDAPVATVLENTLGATIAWTRGDGGAYAGTASAEVFTADKTCLPAVNASVSLDGVTNFVVTSFYRNGADDIRLQTAVADPADGTLSLSDGKLTNAYVEILVYP